MSRKNLLIDILGTEYKIEFHKDGGVPELDGGTGGHCCHFEPLIYISLDQTDEAINYCIRHEVIHAFRIQSGILAYPLIDEEQNVDWMSLQIVKIYKAFEELGVA